MGYHTVDKDGDGTYDYGKHRYANLQVFTFCDEQGYILITCPDCGNTYDSREDAEAQKYLVDMPFFNLNPKGHSYDDDFDAECNNCGEVREAKILVAMIGNQKFESLAEAVEAARNGDEIVLCKDVTLTEKLTVKTEQTWNFGEFTVKFANGDDNYGVVISGDLTIVSGTYVVTGWYGIGVTGKLTVEGGSFSYEAYNDYVIGNWGTTVINDGSFAGQYCCINNFSGTTTINGGAFTTETTDATGEYESCDVLADDGLTVNGGTFSKDVTEYCAMGYHTVDVLEPGVYVYGEHVDADHNHVCDTCNTSWLMGDLDNDGDVDAYDLTILARHVGGIELITNEIILQNADVNGDGNVDAYDLTKHARYVGGIILDWDQE